MHLVCRSRSPQVCAGTDLALLPARRPDNLIDIRGRAPPGRGVRPKGVSADEDEGLPAAGGRAAGGAAPSGADEPHRDHLGQGRGPGRAGRPRRDRDRRVSRPAGGADHHQLQQRRLHHSVPPRRRLHRDVHAARVQDGQADDAGLADRERHPQPDAGREHGERNASPSWARRPASSTRRRRWRRASRPTSSTSCRPAAPSSPPPTSTPGVQSTGPNGGLSINGAMSFESLYVVNGVVVNENIRGQPNVLFIEDALQETTITTAAVSAEFGRFQGGVVQAITKSGGNEFSGSYRMTFDNNDWVALTPFPNDSRTDKLLRTQEATLGGPILKDKLWFFGAARLTGDRVTNGTTFATNLNFDDIRNQKRFEGKLTYALSSKHTFKGAYTKIKDTEDGNFFGNIMDFDSLVNGRATPQDLVSANYTGIVSPKFFVEGQYSRRRFTFQNSGLAVHRPHQGHAAHRPVAQQRALQLADLLRGLRPREARQPEHHGQGHLLRLHRQPGRAQRGGRVRPLRRQALREQPPVGIGLPRSSPRPRSSRGRRSSRCSTTARSSAGRRSSSARRGTASAPTPASSTTPGASNKHLDLQRRPPLRQEQRRGQPGTRGGQGLRPQPARLRDLRSQG